MISGSGGVFGGSPHRTGENVQKRNCSGTEGSKRSSEGRLTSPELGWDRGFILGKHEFTCLYFCAASGVGLAVSARPGPPGRFDGVTH